MKVALLSTFLVCLASLASGETINSLSTHTNCCLSRSLDDDGHVDWLPGQTDTFAGEGGLLECSGYEIGAPPFTVTLFHDGSDGLTLDWIEVSTLQRVQRCNVGTDLDGHAFFKATCQDV